MSVLPLVVSFSTFALCHEWLITKLPVTEQVFWLVIGHSVLQAKRLNTFKELKQSIETLWRELEAVPSTSIGQNLAKDDAEATFKLSSLNIETLKDLKCEVRNITFFFKS